MRLTRILRLPVRPAAALVAIDEGDGRMRDMVVPGAIDGGAPTPAREKKEEASVQ
jgi:hypothetical protein